MPITLDVRPERGGREKLPVGMAQSGRVAHPDSLLPSVFARRDAARAVNRCACLHGGRCPRNECRAAVIERLGSSIRSGVTVSQMALLAAETRDTRDVELVSSTEAAPVSGVVPSGQRLRLAFERTTTRSGACSAGSVCRPAWLTTPRSRSF